MSTILAMTSPARGHLYPVVPILDALAARGHAVHLRTLAAEVPAMRSRGFQASAIEAAVEAIPLDDWRAGNARASIARSTAAFAARAAHDGPDLRAAIEAGEPDVLIVDVNSWGAMAAAEASGRQWAAFCPYPLPIASAGVPPFGPGFAPATGMTGRVRDAVVGPVVRGALARSVVPATNQVRAAVGLAPVGSVNEIFGRPPVLLALTAEPFEYPRAWPANVRLVGPCAWEPDAPEPDWLAGSIGPGRSLVLVATSSEYQADEVLAQAAFDAFADDPNVTVVATVPSGRIEGLRVPANGRAERFLPHGRLLPHAAAAITHGGMGVTQKALAAGVPVVAVPFGRDQLEVARRVEVAGAGVRLQRKQLAPGSLRAAVATARGRADGARAVAAAFRGAGGPEAAASAIEALL
jgi:MGT family glycosyltransferase